MIDSVITSYEYTVHDPTAPSLSVGSVSTSKGSTFTVPVTLSNSPEIAGISFRINYDIAALTLLSAVTPDGFNALEIVMPGIVGNGTLYSFTAPGTAAVKFNGDILLLTFAVVSEFAGDNTTIGISSIDSSNADDQNIPFIAVNGAVKIITYLYGDFTGNGKVDATDVLWIRRYVAAEQDLQKMLESSPPTSINTFVEAAADFTGNITINSTDILWIRRYIASENNKDVMLQLFPSSLTFDHL
jgi:hypothetical protein